MNHKDKFSLATKRVVIGHLTICQGRCCGNTDNDRPPVPVDWLKKDLRTRGLLKRVQLTISGCLGPCDLPNVVTISNESRTQWFGGIRDFNQYRALVDWPCPWRITDLGQNHDAQGYCAPAPRIGQPADAVGVAGPFGVERFEKELFVERFLDVELH